MFYRRWWYSRIFNFYIVFGFKFRLRFGRFFGNGSLGGWFRRCIVNWGYIIGCNVSYFIVV